MKLLHISQRTLQTLRSNNTIKFSKFGNKIYYRRQDIQNILAENYTMFDIRNEYGKKREKKTANVVFKLKNKSLSGYKC